MPLAGIAIPRTEAYPMRAFLVQMQIKQDLCFGERTS